MNERVARGFRQFLGKTPAGPIAGESRKGACVFVCTNEKKIQKWVGIMNNTKVKDKDLPKMGKLCILIRYYSKGRREKREEEETKKD